MKSSNSPSLRDNIAALGVLQLSNYIIPFITLPYITRVLGPVSFGKVVFAQVVIAYFSMLVDYGFSWSATRKISANRENRALISEVFVGTWLAQWILVAASATFVAVLVTSNKRFKSDEVLYVAAFTTIFGNALLPIWFLQGLERLQAIAVIQVSARVLMLLPIFMLVTNENDGALMLLINGFGNILGGIFALYWIHTKQLIEWRWPGLRIAFRELKEGLPLFGSRVSISFYTTFVPLALGWIAGPVAVGNFQVANKICAAAQGMLSPLAQALFPRLSVLFKTDEVAANLLVRRSILAVALLGGCGGTILFVFSHWIVLLLAGNEFPEAVNVLHWLSFVPLIIGLSNMLGVQIMIPNHMNKPFNIILAVAGIIGVILIIPLVGLSQATGAAQAVFLTELIITGAMSIILVRRGYIFKGKVVKS